MASAIIFLDESGDLGWTFNKPYRYGGSSRFLTIAAVCTPLEDQHIPARVIRNLYRERNWNPKTEVKWTKMSRAERAAFAHAVEDMANSHPNISLHAGVVRKERVQEHIRRDPNKLYNYLIQRSLLQEITYFEEVTLVPDARSIKVASGYSLQDYLTMKLWFELNSKTVLVSKPRDSAASMQVQFADMLAGLIQSRFEDGNLAGFERIRKHLKTTQLFFE